jgi:phosphoglycerate kinase
MAFKTLDSYNFKGKKVLLRTDINSDVKEGTSKVLMSERIKEAAITIKELKKKKAKVIVIAHQGTPGKDDFVSLKQHAKLLNKFVKIKFVPHITGEKVIKEINTMKNGDAILLENIRFNKDEFDPEKKDNHLIKLASLGDYYVNDAFSVCHRKQTSIVVFPKILKSCAGRVLEREVKALQKVKIKNCLYILGGAKPEDNIKLLHGNKVLACGLFGQVCLIAKGHKLGYQEKYLEGEKALNPEILEKIKPKLHNVHTPVDFAIKLKDKRVEVDLHKFPNHFEIYDIGTKTIERYVREIKNAKAIYMKGPAGDCSDKRFTKGTFAILKAVSECRGFTLIGGGHLSDAIRDSKIDVKKFDHISLSGGALLNFVAGEKLPGLVALGIK